MADNPSFLGELGIESEEEILARRRRERQARQQLQRNNAINGMNTRSKAQYINGSNIGRGLTNLFRKDEISEDERAKLDVVDKTNSDFRLLEQAFNRAGVPMTAEQRSVRYKDVLSKNASAAGLGDLAQQISQSQYQEKKAARAQDAELAKIRSQTAKNYADANKTGKPTPNTIETVYKKGSTDPNSGQDLFIDPAGNAVNQQGQVVYRLGEYTTAEPNRPPQAEGRSVEDVSDEISTWPEWKRREQLKQSYSLNAQQGIREQGKAYKRLMDVGNDIDNLFKESAALNPDGKQNILDIPGKFQITVGRFADAANGLVRAFQIDNGQTFTALELTDGPRDSGAPVLARLNGNRSSAEAYVKNSLTDDDIQEIVQSAGVGERFMKNKALAAAFAANIVQLTYASMRAEEPGAKQFSDNDFKTNLKTSGGTASNPEEFRRVFLTKVRGAQRQFEFDFNTLPDWGEDLIMDEASLRSIANTKAEFEERYGVLPDEEEAGRINTYQTTPQEAAPVEKKYKDSDDLFRDLN